MKMMKEILQQSTPILFVCVIMEVGAGSILGSMTHHLKLLPGFLVLVPAIMELRGNVTGALGSRLGSALHTGLISSKFTWSDELEQNVIASLSLSLIMSFLIGVTAHLSCLLLGLPSIGIASLVAIALFAGVLSGLFLATITVVLAIASFSHGLDPDNVVVPILATIGDVVTVIFLFLGAGLMVGL